MLISFVGIGIFSDIKDKASRLLDMRLDGEIEGSIYKEKQAELAKEKVRIEQLVARTKDEKVDWEKVINFARHFFTDLPNHWSNLDAPGKKVFLASVFDHLHWDGQKVRTQNLPEIFKEFSAIERAKEEKSITKYVPNFSRCEPGSNHYELCMPVFQNLYNSFTVA